MPEERPTPPPLVLGRDPVVERYKQDVDLGLLEENLKRTPDQRVRAMIELYRVAEELRRAGSK